jgi:mercuric ion transport protein
MSSFGKHLWAGVGAAVIGSVCCVGPLVLLALGVSGAWIGQLTALEPYRPIFIVVMLLFLGLAFRQLYFVPQRCAGDEPCADLRRQRTIFWVVLAGLTALISFPWFAPLLFA